MTSTQQMALHAADTATTTPAGSNTGPLILRRRDAARQVNLPAANLRQLITAQDGAGDAEAAELELAAGGSVLLNPAACDVVAYGLAGQASLGGNGVEGAILAAKAAVRVPAGASVRLFAGETGARITLMSCGAGLAAAIQTGPAAIAQAAVPAQFTPADGGRMLGVANDLVRIIVSGADTQQRYALGTATERPGGGPPPHSHGEAELFYAIDGQVRFWTLGADGQALEFAAGPGDCVLVGHDAPHTFMLDQPEPASVLVLTWSAGLEAMFDAIGTPVTDATEFLAARPPAPTPEQQAQLVEAVGHFGMRVLMP